MTIIASKLNYKMLKEYISILSCLFVYKVYVNIISINSFKFIYIMMIELKCKNKLNFGRVYNKVCFFGLTTGLGI